MEAAEELFLGIVRRNFSYLSSFGFRIPEEGIESNVLYTKIPFFGTHVAIVFSHDIREKAYDCYVGRVFDGKLQVDRQIGGYWSPLHKYLIDFCGYRGGAKPTLSESDCELADLRDYDAMLRQFGSRLLNDSDDAFVKCPGPS